MAALAPGTPSPNHSPSHTPARIPCEEDQAAAASCFMLADPANSPPPFAPATHITDPFLYL